VIGGPSLDVQNILFCLGYPDQALVTFPSGKVDTGLCAQFAPNYRARGLGECDEWKKPDVRLAHRDRCRCSRRCQLVRG
jgi:hypothetical protein